MGLKESIKDPKGFEKPLGSFYHAVSFIWNAFQTFFPFLPRRATINRELFD
jgi:hypothetical protein